MMSLPIPIHGHQNLTSPNVILMLQSLQYKSRNFGVLMGSKYHHHHQQQQQQHSNTTFFKCLEISAVVK